MGEAKRRREAEFAKVTAKWSFPWTCGWCEHEDGRFDVIERKGISPPQAHCRHCSYYMPVGPQHRAVKDMDYR